MEVYAIDYDDGEMVPMKLAKDPNLKIAIVISKTKD